MFSMQSFQTSKGVYFYDIPEENPLRWSGKIMKGCQHSFVSITVGPTVMDVSRHQAVATLSDVVSRLSKNSLSRKFLLRTIISRIRNTPDIVNNVCVNAHYCTRNSDFAPVTEAPQFFASSKTCSKCGHKKKELKLSERTYHCNQCGDLYR